MRANSFILTVAVFYSLNISTIFAGSWNKKTIFDKGKDNSESQITNEETPESSTEGLFSKRWADENNAGLSLAAWLQTQKNMSSLNPEVNNNSSGVSIKQGYQWSERKPPLTAFSCEWTDAFYVWNQGDCDNRSLFNNKGRVETYARAVFDFTSGPQHTLDNCDIRLTLSGENRESKLSRNPKGYLRFGEGKKTISYEPDWDDKPDRSKKWQASAGDIISFSVSMSNIGSDNIIVRGALGSSIKEKLYNKAAGSSAGVFSEISGFELELDRIISESVDSYRLVRPEPERRIGLVELEQIWRRTANRAGLGTDQIRQVNRFLEQIREPLNMQNLDENLLDASIERYLDQFEDNFSGENLGKASFWMAWLLAEAAKREAVTPDDITNTRKSFEALIDKLVFILEDKAKEAIGEADCPEIRQQLGENLARTRGRLLYYFYELRNDPLFPAFKKPVDGDIEEIILEKLRKENILHNLLNLQMKTIPDEEFYAKWLKFYYDRVPERIVFWLVVQTVKEDIGKPEYWGGMHHRARSCSGLWPIEMYLVPIIDREM